MKTVDSIYYRDAGSLSFVRKVSAKARSRMYRLMVESLTIDAGTTIVDVGVSDEEGDETNMLEKLHPWRQNIVCAGLGDGERITKAYPGVRFVHIEARQRLPFGNREFDVACANAVLEHVGGPRQRQSFVEELCRIARSVFVTVPNRWFPVEQHTGIPLLHWSPSLFRRSVRSSRLGHWADPANMDLLGKAALRRAWPAVSQPKLVYTGLNLGPLSSNIAAIWSDRT